MSITAFFNQTLTSRRNVRTADAHGGWTEALTPFITTPVGCSARPASQTERELSRQVQMKVTDVVYVAAPVDIARGDELTLSRGLLAVVEVVNDPGGVGRHLEIWAESRVRGK